MGDGANDHHSGILESDKTAVEQVIHCRSQQKSVFAVEPLMSKPSAVQM